MNLKTQIRKEFLEKRRSLSSKFVNSASDKISRRAAAYFSKKSFNNVMLYADFDKEPKTEALKHYFTERGAAIYYPLIKGNTIIAKMPKNTMTKGSFGILEPLEDSAEIDPEELDLIFVPGIAFDKKRNRIGYGKGFYDKFLCRTKALKAALAYDFQIYSGIFETDLLDIRMNLIITEEEIIR